MVYNGENRRIKATDTKRRIYESAVKLLATNDYSAVSVDDIVKMAGVAKGSFYVHFDSKGALVAALINDQVEKADADYKAFLASFSNDVPAGTVLLSLIGKIADVMVEKIGLDKMSAVYKSQLTKGVHMGEFASYNREIYKMFRDLLTRGIQRREFKSVMPVDELSRHCVMAIRGVTYEWCMRYPDFDYKAAALAHFKLILEGLRNPPLNQIKTAKTRE